jgi:hypothetical protein
MAGEGCPAEARQREGGLSLTQASFGWQASEFTVTGEAAGSRSRTFARAIQPSRLITSAREYWA